MTRSELLAFMRTYRLCIQATVSSDGMPQAAVVGYAVTDDLEIVFDTASTTRKVKNLRNNPRMAIVIGWDEERTLQLEGIAVEPGADELPRLKRVYFEAYPDGVERQSWQNITYVRVRPVWARYSDYNPGGGIVELDEAALRRAGG